MRTLPTLMLGAFTLTLGLLPTIAAAQTPTTPSPTASPQPSETPVDPSPTTSPTAEPSATPTPDPTLPEQLSGEFTFSRDKGKAGRTITVTSKTPCVDRDGKIGPAAEAGIYGTFREPPQFRDYGPVSTNAKGGWSTKFTIPLAIKYGEVLTINASCLVSIDDYPNSTSFLTYEYATFTVTGAGKAPVAQPVPGNPKYTG